MKEYYTILGTIFVTTWALVLLGIWIDRWVDPCAKVKFEECGFAKLLGMWGVLSLVGLLGGAVYQVISWGINR